MRAGLARALRAARRLRGRARQRRHDRLLGRRRRSGSSASARCTSPSASSPRSSRRSPTGAPFLARPDRRRAPSPATRPSRRADPSADVVAWAHNETSTGVMVPGRRARPGDALVLIDATSRRRRPAGRRRAGRRLLLRAAEVLRRRRRAVAGAAEPGRASSASASSRRRDRWIPEFLSLATALDNSRKDQTYNTPAVATLLLLADQLDWMLGHGGLDWLRASARRASSGHLYGWARGSRRSRRRSSPTRPSARSSSARSTSPTTVDAAAVAATLRANGIVDTEPYRKLGRNQLRIGHVPGDRARPTSRRSPPASTGSSSGRRRDARPRRREDRRLRRRAAARALRRRRRRPTRPRPHRRLRRHPHPLGHEARPPTCIDARDAA